jgi:hypothetical protein
MSVTIFGGSDTSYADNNGAPLGSVTGTVWEDEAKASPLTDLRDANGNTTNVVTTAPNGHYKFGVNGWTGSVFVDFGLGPYRVWPADVADRLVAAEALLTAQAAQISSLATAPAAVTFASATDWAPSTVYPAGKFRREPDGSYRLVNVAYTSGSTYGTADTTNSAKATDPVYTRTEAAAMFASIGLQLLEPIVYVGDPLDALEDPDPNGFELLSAATPTSILPELDDVSPDGPVLTMLYRFRPGVGLTAIALTTVPAGKVSPAAPVVPGSTTHTATVASGNPVVADTSVAAVHQGQPVTGTGIPANSFVGTVIAATSFRLSSSPTSQVDVNATAAGTSVQIAPAVACAAHDRLWPKVLSAAGGVGLKLRIGLGTASFTIPAAPSAPTNFVLASSTSTTATFTWAAGTGSIETDIWKRKPGGGWIRVARVFASNTWTDTDVTQGVAADYMAQGRVPGAVSPFTAVLTASPASTWSLLPQTAAGVWDSTKFSTVIGTNNTVGAPSATVDAASGGHQMAHLRSGATGGTTTNDPQDRALIKAIVDTTARRAWGFRALLSPLNTATLLELYLGASGGTFSLTSGATDFLRSTLTPNGISVEGKAASYDPTGEGSTTQGTAVGSFQRFTGSDYQTNIVTGATRTASGTIAFPTAMNPGTNYGLKVIADNPSGGRQLVSVYYGTESQYGSDASGLPLLFTANLTARFVAARAAGLFYLQQLGKQTSPTAVEGWDIKDYFDIMPIGV